MPLVRIDGRYKVFWISTLCLSDHARLGNWVFLSNAAPRHYDVSLAREHRVDLGSGLASCSSARSRVWLSIISYLAHALRGCHTVYLAHALRGCHTVCRDMCWRRRQREREYTA